MHRVQGSASLLGLVEAGGRLRLESGRSLLGPLRTRDLSSASSHVLRSDAEGGDLFLDTSKELLESMGMRLWRAEMDTRSRMVSKVTEAGP